MPMEGGVAISVILGIAAAIRSPSYGIAIFLSAITYIAVKIAFCVAGVIPDMVPGNDPAFSLLWLAGLLGQLTPVVLLGAVVHRLTRPRPAAGPPPLDSKQRTL